MTQPSPDPRRLYDEVRHLVLAAQREGSRRLAAELRTLGLTPAQAEVLEVLRTGGELTLADLGRLLVCEAGSPSRLADSLVRAGLVARNPGEIDRRTVLLGLTERGADLAERLAAATAPLTAFLAERLGEQDAAALAGLLRRLLDGTPGGRALAVRYGRPQAPAGD